jgi:hypothetical protein
MGYKFKHFRYFPMVTVFAKHLFLLCENYAFLKVCSLMMYVLTAIAMTKRVSCTVRMSIMKNGEKTIVIHNRVIAVILAFCVSPLPSL